MDSHTNFISTEVFETIKHLSVDALLEVIAEAKAGRSVDIYNMEGEIVDAAKNALGAFVASAQLKGAPEE